MDVQRRTRGPERLERRELLAADPIHVGVVYVETDYLESDLDVGSDTQGDRFILSFNGGAPLTQLTELRITTDKDGDGISVGDPIFDTQAGGRGKNGFHGFQIVRVVAGDNRTVQAAAEVVDGGQELVLRLENFRAGDRLEFTLDVDEVLRNAIELSVFNDRLDVITSGQEFQDSILDATFEAPHYEVAHADELFVNDFGSPYDDFGLNLPPDEGSDPYSRPNRTAAAIAHTQQVPKPIELSGHVWVDNDLDIVRESGEPVLADVELALFQRNANGVFADTGHRTRTDTNGAYRFEKSLGLMPGEYQIVQTQPSGYLSVGSVPGTVDGLSTGFSKDANTLTGIFVPAGDLSVINMDFAEAQSATLSGFVYFDENNNGIREPGEMGIAGVTLQAIPNNTIAPQAVRTTVTLSDGSYSFDGLAPGSYDIVETVTPPGYVDGIDSAGTVNGVVVGVATNPGDVIRQVYLLGNETGVEYNFGEIVLGSIGGYVYVAAPGADCTADHNATGNTPLSGVKIELQTFDGSVIATDYTSPDGVYFFDDVPIGEYRIVQYTPAGYIDGTSFPGKINGRPVGVSNGGMFIENITMIAAGVGTDYSFCEASPASISGYVHIDGNDDGVRDAAESGVASVTISLKDDSNVVVATTQTDSSGRYEFTGLTPGRYTISETQPSGLFDGKDSVGTIEGQRVGIAQQDDQLQQIDLRQGLAGVEYNFGELQPASLSGMVYEDLDADCERDPDEAALADVVLILRDDQGNEIARTRTNPSGEYRFVGLRPGRYSVEEIQPEGYFDGGVKAGTAGGIVGENRITEIDLTSGENARDYDFCEEPGGRLAGTVFVDLDADRIQDANEQPLQDVTIVLRDEQGEVARTKTDINGNYFFEGLRRGRYTVEEIQPADYFDGGAKAGTAGGVVGENRISDIVLAAGQDAQDYDFCEEPGSELSGFVFVDQDDDCEFDAEEQPIQGVTIQLRDAAGNTVAQTVTDASGRYSFENLRSGTYQIFEQQPEGFFQGGQKLGTGGGEVLGADLMQVSLAAGQTVERYNFCEIAPSSISGSVWSDNDGDQKRDAGEVAIPGVSIRLIDGDGELLQTTTTDSSGRYSFHGLAPGIYSVSEVQPSGFFHGGQLIGSHGGTVLVEDLIDAIELRGVVDAIDYDFPELPPATISGFVFKDGADLALSSTPSPESLRDYRDGLFTSDDLPIAGVQIELRDANGMKLTDSDFLGGNAVDSSIIATDADGFYLFQGLRPGTYSIYQTQPEGFTDSLDTAGTLGGLAINAADEYSDEEAAIIASLRVDAATTDNWDAIIRITVGGGEHSEHNHFSEIQITSMPDFPKRATPPPISVAPAPLDTFEQTKRLVVISQPAQVLPPMVADTTSNVTWHLSVINGGFPRGISDEPDLVASVSARTVHRNGTEGDYAKGRWQLMTLEGQILQKSRGVTLGDSRAVALVGNFDGEAGDEVAIYVAGRWYVDLNGNGVWDAGDLWIKLGTDMDRPVVGDWDGDGKDDIGIFGRQWERDEFRVRQDAGLPDPANARRRRPNYHNRFVSAETRMEGRERLLVRGEDLQLRADAVDHVFQFGEEVDTPISGDWNGTGIDQIAVFRGGTWMLDSDGDGRHAKDEATFEFGEPGDQPVVGDFNGDGIDEVAVVRGDEWIIDIDGDHKLTGNDKRIKLKRMSADSQPIAGDWDGDGKDEPGYYDKAG
ncbi:MSCRAMM family protein [Stieleria varia]|uniref:Serine-aspartate repeat-containing protein D n=1 Tax=Stieleria varia TaxID=2528005 RepID=A0A5C6B2X2_9BACT|nr:SdrD B-like domain-containing protein [Stieleria varia]TWU05881.1 Serine-aspartate repeat-containing protein D precursor [Stieleria varia]